MIPPTPTPLPPGQAVIDLGSTYSLWSSTDGAIHTWRMLGDWGAAIQLLLIVALVIVGMFVVKGFVNQIVRRDAEE